ncbi:hypothetical protein FNV43_RR12248 [Rhamnella rubrinervis]|uniref:Uncharacterized protein n=1 Tax=Rhamnella rubrinervis TaxID=2594499 RepID=A0A8K0MIM6_9ROSA|nr:hypothetical protein FNV43_RR12248 [Rhamnella rubrinervis]
MISEDQSSPSSSSLKDKLFKSSTCLSGCFSISSSVHHEILDNEEGRIIHTPRSTYYWLKSTAHELPEIRDRCRNLIFRIGRGRRNLNSGDFRYDPSSYALNFDDDSRDDEFPLRDFSSRLPPSPPIRSLPQCVAGPASLRREIVGFS